MTKRSKLLIRLFIGGGLFLAVALNVDIPRLAALVAELRWRYLVPAVGALLVNRLLVYYRLKRLLETGGIIVPFGSVVKLYWMCDFGSLFVPGTVGADVLKVLSLKHYLKDTHQAAASIFIEQFMGLFSLLLIAFVSLLIIGSDELNRHFFRVFLAAGSAGLAAGAGLFIFPDTVRRLAAAILPSGKMFAWAGRLIDAVLAFSGFKRLLLSLSGLCLVIHGLRILMVYLVSLSLGLDIAPIHVFLFFPLVMAAVTLPVTVGGLGVRETAFVFLFAMVGVGATDAFALSLVSALLPVVIKLGGGLIYIRKGLPEGKDE